MVLSESDQDLPDYLKDISKANELTNIGSFVSFSTAPNDGRYSKIISLLFPTLLFFFRFFLFLGMAASVIGYVGCFSLIQASKNNRGPLIWLGTEVALCLVRFIIWASNPGWDDPPPPIALRKVRSKENSEADGTEGDNSVTYDVSWTLDDVTADDMHALIIGIDEVASFSMSRLKSAVADAEKVVAYLKDDLAVPDRQITSLKNTAATASAITGALGALATNNTVRRGAPILIYIASHSDRVEVLTDHGHDEANSDSESNSRAAKKFGPVRKDSAAKKTFPQELPKADVKLVTYDYDRENKNTGLSYAKILDLLQTIATSKGENIVSYCRFSQDFWI